MEKAISFHMIILEESDVFPDVELIKEIQMNQKRNADNTNS
jgi:hypothetical protein